jgi:gluconate 2-dehydrogenase gamma chain
MKNTGGINRRRFLQTAVTATALTAACSKARPQGRVLTGGELESLEAMCEQIIPADQDPGASWAGVANFIDRQLSGFYREHRQAYLDGIAEADRRAGGSFAKVSKEGQFEIMKEMEKGESTKAFFTLLVSHTMQGFYGNPRHGGNRTYCSWRMLGVPASPVRGRDRYEFKPGGGA